MKVDCLDVLEAIKTRSIRTYTAEKVSGEDIKQLIEAARWAPSAGNLQPWAFIIVKDSEMKRKLSAAALNQKFIQNAPVVIIVCADITRSRMGYGSRGANLYSIQDTAAATQNIHLAAQKLGLATCWVGAFQEKEIANLLNAPMKMKPVAIVVVGHPSELPRAPTRRSTKEIVYHETF